ncbi:MAG TPA: sigma 54-interacting transcriptional regulator [Candidatus Sulfotelmatobacter sp.]|nr:sigma 54-interacting transcriptional regulator [Candidatus Sulfotelmatobacter sp.]
MVVFKTIFESAPDAIVMTDWHGRIVRVNAQAEKLFGYSSNELVGQSVEILVPERLRPAHVIHRESEPARHQARPFGALSELSARRKDGSEFPADIMLSPVETDEGWVAVAIIRDLTERKQAEDRLRESEENFRLLIEGVKDYAIIRLNPDGCVASWNMAAERIFGYHGDEIIGQDFARFFIAEDIKCRMPEEELGLALAKGRVEEEGWRVRKDGSQFWANVTITALTDETGVPRGFAKVTRDFTDRKRVEDALLLEITNVLVSKIDIRELLAAISASLSRVKPHEYANLALKQPETDHLRVLAVDSPYEKDPIHESTLLPVKGSPAGLAFSSGKPLLLNQIESGRFSREVIGRLLKAEVKSACFLPLISRNRVLGTLNVYSRSEAHFAQKDVELLSRVANQVGLALDNAMAFRQLRELKDKLVEETLYLQDELRTEAVFDEIIGESVILKRVLKQVENVARTDATVLILGETGTGKELIARAIHNLSTRHQKAFVKLNCAAIPIGLLESELFGHEKGAFTGAMSQKIGRLDLAHRGTLFLDEVGDIPLELQPKLLRVLQEQEFERLGSARTIPVDVRLITATNRKLAQMVADGRFRDDLYYRLKVFPLTAPALRDRREDIPLLVRYFVQKHATRMNKRVETIPPDAMNALVQWHWPGNVRELGNFLERAVILTQGPILQIPLDELKLTAEMGAPAPATFEAAEREIILRVLREARGVVGGPRGAAVRLGLKRTTLTAKMHRLGVSRKDL